MASVTTRRIIRGAVGLFFAFVYGFWIVLSTGGGHGNFIWVYIFMIAGLYGLYYPIMAALSADLRPTVLKVIFGALIVFHLLASTILMIAWIFALTDTLPDDFEKTFAAIGMWGLLFSGAVHFLPTAIFAFQWITAIAWGSSPTDDETNILEIS